MRCGNQKEMGTLDSLLLYGAYLYVEGCYVFQLCTEGAATMYSSCVLGEQ